MNKRVEDIQKGGNKKKVITITLITSIMAIIVISFAFFGLNIVEDNNFITSGDANKEAPDFVYTDTSSGINLTATYPMSDSEGLEQSPYTFNIANNGSESITCEIYLQTSSTNTIPNNLISVSLDGSSPLVLSNYQTGNPSEGYSSSYKISEQVLDSESSLDFALKAWINSSGTIETVQNKSWTGKIYVKARYTDN